MKTKLDKFGGINLVFIIKTVLLGPKCNANERDIVNFLRLNGFECLVEKSNGSYR
mgnify:CR=1 FL=1